MLIESPMPTPDPAVLAAAVVTVRSGVPLKIGDFASVELAAALRAGDALVQGRDGVLLTISSQFGANTLDVTRALETALADIVPRLTAQGITVYPGAAPARDFHRARARQSARRSRARGRDRARRAVRVPARRACRADLVRHDSAVARRRDARARPLRLHAQRDDARRLRGRDRRARRRRDHRRREHHAPLARERVARARRGRASTSCATRRSRSARP